MEENRTMIENNQVTLSGEIVSNFDFSHEFFGERFYIAQLESKRESFAEDIVSIMVSDGIVDVKADWMGRFVKISGQFRSYNKHDGNGSRLILFVFVKEFEFLGDILEEIPIDENDIFLDGYICKPTTYRKTPLGREISDILLAVNRKYGKTDYIPCITWGRNAVFTSDLEIGTRLRAEGRIQSRIYCKKLSEGKEEERIAYEVSISRLEVVQNE